MAKKKAGARKAASSRGARKKTKSRRGVRKGGARSRVTVATTPAGLEHYPKRIVFTPIKQLITAHMETLRKAPQTDEVKQAYDLLQNTKTQLAALCAKNSMALDFP